MLCTARCSPLRLLLAVSVLAVVVTACGGGKKSSPGGGAPASETDLSGTYVVVQDSDGTRPKAGATVTLVLDKGTLSVKAVSAGEELTDTGTYSVRDGRMTIAFVEQGMSATDQPYKLDGETLEIPVKMFSEGAGSSTWKRTDGQAATKSTPAAQAELKSDWSLWDLKKDAAAAATKHFVEAVNEKGTAWPQAVTETAAFARGLSNVSDATVSPNGLNITIQYKDGTGDYVVTERTSFDSEESAAIDAPVPQRLVSAQPVAAGLPRSDTTATNVGCVALPGSPATSRPPEPGREGLNPAGGYGVVIYDPQAQPKPINSADSPPKRALLVAPAYELAHPLRHGKTIDLLESFKDAVGPTIECMQDDLTGAGYTVDTILGQEVGGKSLHTGDQAVEELANLLAKNRYGVFYVMSHGTNITSWAGLVSESWMYMGLLDINRPELKKAVNGRKLDKNVNSDIVKALATLAGLTWDGSGDAPFVVGAEFQGSAVIWVTPAFFKMLKSQRAVSFDETLVFLNTCSSAADTTLMDAMKPKAFFGWTIPMDGPFITDAAETMFDSLTDKARSARNAWQMWSRHEAWRLAGVGSSPPDNKDPKKLKVFGVNGTAYAPITDQSVLLIYRIRHGPSSASSDMVSSLLLARDCARKFWSAGKHAGLADPSCRPMEFGVQLPTDEEVDDAVFEIGGTGTRPYGRWTLAD